MVQSEQDQLVHLKSFDRDDDNSNIFNVYVHRATFDPSRHLG